MIEDTELLRRYAELHSEEAFAELVRRRIGLVYSVAVRHTRDAQRAEDVTQTVFTDLARKAAALAGRPVLAGWLYRSAHYAAIDLVRSEQSRAAREREVQIMHEILGGDGSDVEWEKIRPVLDAVISELGGKDRDAILLRFFDGRSFGDIAARLQLTENTARMRVERALDKLHALLARRGIRSATSALGIMLAHQASAAAPVGLAATVTGASLASAKVTGATVLPLFQLMINSKTALSAAGLGLALIFGTTAFHVYTERKVKAALAETERGNGQLLVELRGWQQRAEAADQAAAGLRAAVAGARAAQADERQRAAAAAQAAREAALRAGEEFMANHPEVKEAYLNKLRAEAAGNYAWLFRSLDLSPVQIETFKDLRGRGQSINLATPDGKSITYNTGGDTADAKLQLQALLGEEGFRQYQAFDARALQLTTELAGNLYSTSAPLTAEQADRVRRIIGAHRDATASGATYDWTAIMAEAQPVLSEPQLSALGAAQAYAQYDQEMNQARRRLSPVTSGK